VLFVVAQRLIELIIAQRNTSYLLSNGGVEYGAGHYPVIVGLHAAWLVCVLLFGSSDHTFYPSFLVAFVALQAGRVWVIFSLGRNWTTRVIVVPGRPLIRRGPYKFLRHPNYLIVALEILILPLAFGAWKTAFVFSVLNGAVLYHRIRVENSALRKALISQT
jgi:methyltransferase